jgi:hypothetical protein
MSFMEAHVLADARIAEQRCPGREPAFELRRHADGQANGVQDTEEVEDLLLTTVAGAGPQTRARSGSLDMRNAEA